MSIRTNHLDEKSAMVFTPKALWAFTEEMNMNNSEKVLRLCREQFSSIGFGFPNMSRPLNGLPSFHRAAAKPHGTCPSNWEPFSCNLHSFKKVLPIFYWHLIRHSLPSITFWMTSNSQGKLGSNRFDGIFVEICEARLLDVNLRNSSTRGVWRRSLSHYWKVKSLQPWALYLKWTPRGICH